MRIEARPYEEGAARAARAHACAAHRAQDDRTFGGELHQAYDSIAWLIIA